MQEILEAVPSTKNKTDSSVHDVLSMQVRGKSLCVLNARNAVTLAFKKTDANLDSLEWFLGELVGGIRDAEVPPAPKQRRFDPDGEVITKTLNHLKEHESCQSAFFSFSRGEFHVKNTRKVLKVFKIREGAGRKTKRKAIEETRAALIEQAGFRALQFLDNHEEEEGH